MIHKSLTSARNLSHAALLALVLAAPVAARADEVPLWEGVEISEAQKQASTKLLDEVGDATGAAEQAMNAGWQSIGRQNVEAAIQNFNQAWLLNPADGAVYWGLAVATGIRGDAEDVVDRYFEKTRSIIGEDSRLLTDWARIYEQRFEYAKARAHFEDAIKSNPNDTEPHLGMVRIGQKMGDIDLVKKHQTILYELKK